MIKKLTLLAGFGAGYVLGAKAGTERYDQIVAKARELAGMPAVQGVTTNLSQTASTLADTAKSKANETISTVASAAGSTDSAPASSTTASNTTTSSTTTGGKADSTVDLTTGTEASGYDTGATPMAGAAASDTV